MSSPRWLVPVVAALLLALGGCALKTSDPAAQPPPGPGTLLKQKKYRQALLAMLQDQNLRLQKSRTLNTLWRTNHQLVTAQWYLQKAIIALRRGQPDQARRRLVRALKVYPHHRPSQLMLAALNRLPAAARERLAAVKRSKPAAPAGVEDIFPEGLEPSFADQELADHYFTLGRGYLKQGRLELASLHWRMALALDPSHRPCRQHLVKLLTNQGLRLYGQGKLAAAIKQWKMALSFAPDSRVLQGYLQRARRAKKKMGTIGR